MSNPFLFSPFLSKCERIGPVHPFFLFLSAAKSDRRLSFFSLSPGWRGRNAEITLGLQLAPPLPLFSPYKLVIFSFFPLGFQERGFLVLNPPFFFSPSRHGTMTRAFPVFPISPASALRIRISTCTPVFPSPLDRTNSQFWVSFCLHLQEGRSSKFQQPPLFFLPLQISINLLPTFSVFSPFKEE